MMTETTRSDAAERLAVHFAGPRAADEIHDAWRQLLADGPAPASATFDRSQVAHLPDAARRWLTHAITEGTALARAVVLQMHGHIRVKPWLPFRAVQLHVPPAGYLWMARAGRGPATIRGYDRFFAGIGEMRWRLLGQVPLLHATGSDVDRSAAGRVALDAFSVPTAWLSAATTWQPGPTLDTAVARWRVDDQWLHTEIRVAPNGALRSLGMPRWGAPGKEKWAEWPCGGSTTDERQFGGSPSRPGYAPATSSAHLDGPMASSSARRSPTPTSCRQDRANTRDARSGRWHRAERQRSDRRVAYENQVP